MRQEKIGFGIIFRMFFSLIPLAFGMRATAVVLCAYNIAMSYVVFGPKTSFISSLCSVGISMMLYGFFYGDGAQIIGLFMAAVSILCALGCIIGIKGKKPFFSCVWLSAAGALVPIFGWFRFFATTVGMSVSGMFAQITEDAVMTVKNVLNEQIPGGAVFSELQFDEIALHAGKFAGLIVPAISIILAAMLAYILNWAVNCRLRGTNYPVKHYFSQIRIPVPMTVMFIVSAVAVYLNVRSDVTVVCINLFIIFAFLSLIAGMSLIESVLKRAHIKPFLRFMIQASAVYFGLSLAIAFPVINIFAVYMCLAIADSLFNFRKLDSSIENKVESEENAHETKK